MHFKTAWHHIRRSPYQALAAVVIMTLTFLVISVFTFLVVGSSKIISYFESKPQVTAFFHNEAKASDITSLEEQLKVTGKIASMHFVSQQQAYNIYKEQNKNDPLLLELVTADILPASLEISTNTLSQLPQISTLLKNSPIVQEVVFQKDVVSTLTLWTNAIRLIGTILIIVLSFVSIFIMTTIIGIKIAQKRQEIEIMRLLGATKWYICSPFLLEGIFYGLVGSFFGWLIASSALLYATPFLLTFLKGIPLLPVPWTFFVFLLGGEFLLAIFLGSLASLLAVSRYVK